MKNLPIKLLAIFVTLVSFSSQAQITEDDIINQAKKSLNINKTSIVNLSLYENVTTNDVIRHLKNTSNDNELMKSIDKYSAMLTPEHKEVYSLDYIDNTGTSNRTYVILSDDKVEINKDFEHHYSVAHTEVVTHLLEQIKTYDQEK